MITADEARRLWRYDPGTGYLWWRVPARGRPVNKPAGTLHPQGHVQIGHNGRQVYAHRLIWLIVHGAQPNFQVYHINGNKSDNRLVNLMPGALQGLLFMRTHKANQVTA